MHSTPLVYATYQVEVQTDKMERFSLVSINLQTIYKNFIQYFPRAVLKTLVIGAKCCTRMEIFALGDS